MADIAARREARRRKILENSQNRLKLITGDQNGPITVPEIPEPKDLVPKVQDVNNDYTRNEPTVDVLLQAVKYNHENHIHEDLLRNFLPENINLSSLIPEQSNDVPDSSNNNVNIYVKHSKLYVVSLAIIIRLLFIFQMQFCVRDSIVLPFIIFELTLQYFRNNGENTNALLNTLLLLSSLPPNRVKLITRILKFIEDFTADFSLYFFTFLVLHVFLESFI